MKTVHQPASARSLTHVCFSNEAGAISHSHPLIQVKRYEK